MDVYLVDGTYELFRHFYAVPSHVSARGEEVAATRGVVASIVSMLESGITHIGVATDHVIESFRNNMWPGYKTSEGVDPSLLAQFPLLEESLDSMGVVVWPMVELEADDALAGVASSLNRLSKINKIYICSPDKDLAQCVRNDKVVLMDRRRKLVINEAGVMEKFGVLPDSIPDFLALVGDSADGYPGLEGWGEKSAGAVLKQYQHLELIPTSTDKWKVQVRNMQRLCNTLRRDFKLALLFRDLATLRTREPVIKSPDELRWKGPTSRLEALADRIDYHELVDRLANLRPSQHNN